ncbi:hypothetical protein N7495_007854 [Penicillium taxi]|uniref:uncharacterized protein n=1 Tax=Penicillium taxi TaxID=168475 RepID=UPI0025452A42|nr:uncharacterized protein N7495_007854 [Penicillium taxi]KAJ5887813.1 hypothetical protein N7495_007854 [Penicillium taxi]
MDSPSSGRKSVIVDAEDELKFPLQNHLRNEHHLEITKDGKFVRWYRENPKHPRNWSTSRKIYDVGLVCLLDLIITASSTAGAAAAKAAEQDYHVTPTYATFCFVTLFLLSQAVGSIIFPPWSESFGRKYTYIFCSALSCICCLVIGVVESNSAAITMRIIAGFLASIPATVVGGSIEDMFNSQDRIWVMFFWTVASNIGMIIGPIMSSHLIELLNWRWVFYVYAIALGITTGALWFIRESRSSLLLTREVNILRNEILSLPPALSHDHSMDFATFTKEALFRPAQFFFREPIIFVTAIMISVSNSIIFIFTEALQPIYQNLGFSAAQASLIFMAIGLGVCFSTLTRILDTHIFNKKRRQGLTTKPEDKLLGLIIGSPALAIGLWWFAWTIPPILKSANIPWIVPTMSLVLVGYALTEIDTLMYGYIADSYLTYSASATAAVAFLRGVLCGTFPLFTNQMFHWMGANIAVSVLASVATVFCAVLPLFMCYGERIRRRSRFANHSWEIQKEIGNDDDDL